MSIERILPPDRLRDDQGYSVRRIESATFPLPPRTDEELAAMRAAHPDQAWFWDRTFYDEMRADQQEEDADRAAGRTRAVYYSDEEFAAALRGRGHDASDADV